MLRSGVFYCRRLTPLASFLDILAPSRVPDTQGIGRRTGPADLESCIRFDIQTLLNARRPPEAFTAGFAELPASMINFGLRDYAFAEMECEERVLVAKHIEDVLAAHEPRLISVKVDPKEVNESDPNRRMMIVSFSIAARIRGPAGEASSGFDHGNSVTLFHQPKRRY